MRWVASNTDPQGNTGFQGWVIARNVDGVTTLARRFVEDQPAGPATITVEFDAPTSPATFRLAVTDSAAGTLAEKNLTLTPGPVPAPEHATFTVPRDGTFTVTIEAGAGLYLEELVVDTGKVNAFGVTVDRVRALASHVTVEESNGAPVDPVFGGGGLQRKIRTADVQNWIEDVSAVVDMRLSKRSKLTEQAQKDTLTSAAAAIIATGAAAYLVDAAFPTNASPNDSGSYGQVLWTRYRNDLEALVEQLTEWTTATELSAGSGRAGGYFPPPAFPDTLRW